MEINGKNLFPVTGGLIHRIDTEETPRVQKQERQSAPADSDRIELSVRGREIQHLDEMIQSTPDVRADRVAEVRSAIENGTYNVKAEKIAEKMIGGSLIDEIF